MRVLCQVLHIDFSSWSIMISHPKTVSMWINTPYSEQRRGTNQVIPPGSALLLLHMSIYSMFFLHFPRDPRLLLSELSVWSTFCECPCRTRTVNGLSTILGSVCLTFESSAAAETVLNVHCVVAHFQLFLSKNKANRIQKIDTYWFVSTVIGIRQRRNSFWSPHWDFSYTTSLWRSLDTPSHSST